MMNAIHHDELPSFYFMQYEIIPSLAGAGEGGRRPDEGRGGKWCVRNLLLVPHFAFPPSAIIKRKPLAAAARRHGWVGCDFALNRILVEARIEIIITRGSSRRRGNETLSKKSNQRFLTSSPTNQTIIIPPEEVRAQFGRVKPLKEIGVKERGWTLDVLNGIRSLVESRRRGDESLTEKSEIDQSLLTSSPTNEFTNGDAYTLADQLAQLHPDNRHIRDKIRQQLQVLRDAGLLLHVERSVWRLP